MLQKLKRQVSLLLVVSFCLLNFNVPKVDAQMVGTNAVIAGQQALDQRAQVAEFMTREDVRQIMTQHGVDPVEAQQRVDSLSDGEIAKLANSIDQLPAGGDGIGVIVGAAVLIFLVLLVTDLLGLTHVFPFVTPQR